MTRQRRTTEREQRSVKKMVDGSDEFHTDLQETVECVE